jgi:transcriptional antiterminator
MPTDNKYLTVPEAAVALGISTRQARRLAQKLADAGLTTTDDRGQRLVTLDDMKAARAGTISKAATPEPESSTAPSIALLEEKDKRIEEQAATIKTLSTALDQAQRLHLATLAELQQYKAIESADTSDDHGQPRTPGDDHQRLPRPWWKWWK